MQEKDVKILRELAKKYKEISSMPGEEKKRQHWRDLNSLQNVPPPIYVRAFAWNEMPDSVLQCEDEELRGMERQLRELIFHHSFTDDFIFEPWVTVNAIYACQGWGIDIKRNYSENEENIKGSFKVDYPLNSLADVEKLVMPVHAIDEKKTLSLCNKVSDAIGDIITVNMERGPFFRNFGGDISTDMGYLRGIENIMMDMMDNPEWLHRLAAFLRDGVLGAQTKAETDGDYGLSSSYNQAMAYSHELDDPKANARGIKRKDIWCFLAAQEFTCISPEMHMEFLLNYQLPIIKEFGLCAYGCCEDLSNKIEMLRQIPNLRRIAVSPFANVKKCAEQIGKDYVISYRPSPTDMVSYDFSVDRVEDILKRDFELLRGCIFDITLKDVETVQRDRCRITKWVSTVRNCIDKYYCS